MGNHASAKKGWASSVYCKEVMGIRRHMKLVYKCWNADNFVVHREQACFIIDVMKQVWVYVKKHELPDSPFPIPIQIYWLLESLYASLQEVRSLEDFWDFRPSMGMGLLTCGQDLCDLRAWATRLGTNFELPINRLRHYQHLRPDDPQAVIIKGIVENAERSERISLPALELERDVILPYLSRIDKEFMAQRMGEKIHIRRDSSLVEKKKEFLRNILQGSDHEDGHGDPPLQVVDAGDLSGTGELLGSGSFGNVYQVEWLGSLCALKQFNWEGEYWTEEANILSRLCHPNIGKVFGKVPPTSSNPHPGILMELLGKSLHHIIFERKAPAQGPFTKMVALDITHQIARAMQYLHGRDIIHGDLKPANVLTVAASPRLEEPGRLRVKLIDFGVAKLKEKGCSTETMTSKQGTSRYRAPEVVAGDQTARYSLSADVYSFGVTAFEILTGKEGNADEISRDNSMDEIMTDLLQRCLDGDPHNRPSFHDVCKDLEKIIYDLQTREGGNYC